MRVLPIASYWIQDILREERVARQNRENFLGKTKKKQQHIKVCFGCVAIDLTNLNCPLIIFPILQLELAGIQRYIQDVCSATADPKNLQSMLEKFEVHRRRIYCSH